MNPTQQLLYTCRNTVEVDKRKEIAKHWIANKNTIFMSFYFHYFSQMKENQKLSSISTQLCPLGPNKRIYKPYWESNRSYCMCKCVCTHLCEQKFINTKKKLYVSFRYLFVFSIMGCWGLYFGKLYYIISGKSCLLLGFSFNILPGID